MCERFLSRLYFVNEADFFRKIHFNLPFPAIWIESTLHEFPLLQLPISNYNVKIEWEFQDTRILEPQGCMEEWHREPCSTYYHYIGNFVGIMSPLGSDSVYHGSQYHPKGR